MTIRTLVRSAFKFFFCRSTMMAESSDGDCFANLHQSLNSMKLDPSCDDGLWSIFSYDPFLFLPSVSHWFYQFFHPYVKEGVFLSGLFLCICDGCKIKKRIFYWSYDVSCAKKRDQSSSSFFSKTGDAFTHGTTVFLISCHLLSNNENENC